MDFKKRINKAFDDVDKILQDGTSLPAKIRVPLRHALENLATACTSYDDYDRGYLSNSRKPIKSSTYQFVAEFDGHYKPRVIDYISKPGYPFWIDANEDYSNGKIFTEQELSKVAKQLERYYAETGGGASDIEIVRDNGDSVYLEEFLQEGSFDKAWEKAVAEEQNWDNK